MNTRKVLDRFTSNPRNTVELRRVARALGNELPRQRLDYLRAFRTQMARVAPDDASYAAGYVSSMLDVTAAYESTLTDEQQDGLLQQAAAREGWRDVLAALRAGPLLPSELAARLGRDRPAITRTLRQLRSAGLVRASDAAHDGRTRPHALTAHGRHLLARTGSAISSDVERGINIAVRLFQYLLAHETSSSAALDTLAEELLGDGDAARAAVRTWAREADSAGVVSTRRNSAAGDELYRMSAGTSATVAARSTLLWQNVPFVLSQLEQYRQEAIPVYVRTGEEGWAAWAHALHAKDARGTSRTIVNGDLRSRAVMPPDERFDLLYDDPAVIGMDLHEPTMRAFIEQADAKFVVTSTGNEAPEGFIPLELHPASRAT